MTIQFTVHVISMYWYKFNSLHELDCQISSKSNKYKFWDVVCLHYPLQQRQQLLQQLLGIFPRPTNFFNGKTNCCSYTMSFCDKDVNFKLIFPSFSMAFSKPVGLSEFLILEKYRKFWHCHRKEPDVKHLYHFKVRYWDLNLKTVPFYTKFNALLLWKPSWLEINCKN